MVKRNTKGLRDSGLGSEIDEYGNQEENTDADAYKSKLVPSEFEYEKSPEPNIDFFWTSVIQCRKEFEKYGLSLAQINADKSISAEKEIQDLKTIRSFFSKADLNKMPIEAHVDVMIRRKGTEYYRDEKGREKSRVREYLVYHMTLTGESWMGLALRASIEGEGSCASPKNQLYVNVDENGRQRAEYRMVGTREVFYIPFSKSKVSEILTKYKTDPNTVKWYVFVPENNYQATLKWKYNGLNYREFSDLSFEELCDIAEKARVKHYKEQATTLQQKGIA